MEELNITKEQNGTEFVLALEGRLDTMTYDVLENALEPLYEQATSIVLDMEGLKYISSAGLRVIMFAEKVMKKKDGMIIRNVNRDIMDIIEATGFALFLTFE